MGHYEIRILRDDGTTGIMVAALHINDNAAIQSARSFAGSRKFEVWRGIDCIFGTDGAEVINLPTANRPTV
jgi:hypothetical protein